MVIIIPAPAALSPEGLSCFYTTDELLSNGPVLIFYGPTATSTAATHSRIQAHIYTPAGIQNFARLIISPTATFYHAVTCLPREEQGDEICRGLAFSLYKYFAELPPAIKTVWEQQYNSLGRLPSAPALFSDAHAAMIAARMVRVENGADIIPQVRHALGEQHLSWIDLDVVLPQGAIRTLDAPRESAQFDEPEEDTLQQRYGQYAKVVKLFGEPAFLPTSKLKRAPSKPTGLNRSQSFSVKQKESLRAQLNELLDTEENYVSKLYDLINNVAKEFREKAKHKSFNSSSPSEQILKDLFPPSLDQILEVNSCFLDAIRAVLDETENEAIEDIAAANDDIFVAPLRGQKDPRDATGAVKVAKTLVEWFPKFGDCYPAYTEAHANFPQLLKGFTKDAGSSFSKRIQETGEQRLMSLLIEPVQRLPRYTLYIDSMIKQLPMRHPAIRPFLKARDIISEICSREAPSAKHTKVCNRIRKMVFSWPPAFNPQGRFITAIDFVELHPPYYGDIHGQASNSGVFLLFTDFLVMLHKPNGCTITARSIIADVDNPKLEPTSSSTELLFHQQIRLSDVFLSEHSDGHVLQLISPVPNGGQPGRPRSRERQGIGMRMFSLGTPYEGKVKRLVEDVTKAKVEGRFPESEREGSKWEVRSVSGDLSLFSSITEDVPGTPLEGRGEPAKVQVLVDPSKLSDRISVGEQGVELVVSISPQDDDFFLVEICGSNAFKTKDRLTSKEIPPVLTKRLGNFFQIQTSIKNPVLCEAFLLKNQQILKSLQVQVDDTEEGGEYGGKPRPHSPVKMLSNLFGGSVGKDGGSVRKLQRNPPSLGGVPRIPPPLQRPPSRGQSRDGELYRPMSSSSKNSAFNSSTIVDPLAKLEETLSTLIIAMNARKGNVVGRNVRARTFANELAVNELYNGLLENPASPEQAAQASVDVLFAAFEKFIRIAWKEKMGPVISQATLVSLQFKSDVLQPGEFEDFFRMTFNEMAPQNQRALKSIIQLLANLLDGTENDGDRGILTVAFAEILVPEGHANEYISLIDRFIQDMDVLFVPQPSGMSTPNYNSAGSKTTHSTATGSLTSNTSLRKRLGFGASLSRENSKSESESKVGYLWRSLSKNSHGAENSSMRISPKRPSSRDRPTVLGSFPFENPRGDSPGPQGRAWLGSAGLESIGEVPSSSGPPRKKRRSSLSDLVALQSANNAPAWSPQTPQRNDTSRAVGRQSSNSPHTPSPAKQSNIPTPSRFGPPLRKENSPCNALDRTNSIQAKSPPSRLPLKGDEVTFKSYTRSPTKRRTDSISAIPTFSKSVGHAGLSERPTSGNTVKLPPATERSRADSIKLPPATERARADSIKMAPSTPRSPIKPLLSATPFVPASTPRRLKLQSPVKLRERLEIQQRDIEIAGRDLQAELSAIGHELSARTPRTLPGQASPDKSGMEARMAMLENRIKTTLDGFTTRTTTITMDVTSSLQVSEARCKELDKLYREANAENEALYSKFNEEFERMAKTIRRGGAEQETQKKIREQNEELARLRKENSRLKREVAGLRAQIRE
ncbi:hypothetical protein GQ43DRAFT_89551 [Delitschia confertaspora ATCC 74209]|uniref:DH domain-containing protein n=1 Tax=Delitschia confertaspora ATCC 74209 TaxID=1513339 RepID=A0A9P4JIN6_9PLEO|nr:hypothetical protein GQ43DRAFT_89551 [Delitschia confertaspora ATCC 74209]